MMATIQGNSPGIVDGSLDSILRLNEGLWMPHFVPVVAELSVVVDSG